MHLCTQHLHRPHCPVWLTEVPTPRSLFAAHTHHRMGTLLPPGTHRAHCLRPERSQHLTARPQPPPQPSCWRLVLCPLWSTEFNFQRQTMPPCGKVSRGGGGKKRGKGAAGTGEAVTEGLEAKAQQPEPAGACQLGLSRVGHGQPTCSPGKGLPLPPVRPAALVNLLFPPSLTVFYNMWEALLLFWVLRLCVPGLCRLQ